MPPDCESHSIDISSSQSEAERLLVKDDLLFLSIRVSVRLQSPYMNLAFPK